LQAELGDDPLDTAGADGRAGLAEFLGQDLGRGLRIQEAIADHLLDELGGAAVVGLGTAFLVDQRQDPALLEEVAQLEVALFTVGELLGGLQGA